MLELTWDMEVDLAHSGARGGAGLLETVRVQGGGARRLPAHRARLAAGAAFLGLPEPPPLEALEAFLAPGTAGLDLGVLRLVAVDGELRCSAGPWAPRWPERIRVEVAEGLRRYSASPLCRFKTLSRLENVLLEREARARGLFEVIAPNETGSLTDGSRTSLFLVRGGRLLTPAAADGALPGVARAVLLDAGLAEEASLRPADLERAEAVFLTNALQGLVPVADALAHPRVREARARLDLA
jgi:branched-chain amino acid aminotransferase